MKIVERNNKSNYLKPDGTYISDIWFDGVNDFNNEIARVNLNNKWNFVKTDGTYLSDIWFPIRCLIIFLLTVYIKYLLIDFKVSYFANQQNQ